MITRNQVENLNGRLGIRKGKILHTALIRKWKEQNECCGYCGRQTADDQILISHAMPVPKGGRNTIHNVVLACKSCVALKGSLTLEEWEEKQAELADLEPLIAEVGEEFLEEGKFLIDWEEEELMLHGELDFIC